MGLRIGQTEHIYDHSLPHRILGSTMTTTNGTYPWSFITTQNTWFNYDYDKRNISMIIHYHTEYLVQPWLRQTKHIHDHSLPQSILGSTMTTTNGTYPWSFITTKYTWFNYDYDKRNISMIIHYHTEYLVQLWLRQTNHIHDHSLPHRTLGSTMTTTNGTYPWSFITAQNTWFNYDYDKRNISMITHYHTEYLVQPWLRQTKLIHDHSLPQSILGSTKTTTNGTYPWSFITTQNTWFNYDYDKRNISMIIHYHTEYFAQLWLRQMKHIHDHSLPHRILRSTITTTNETYPWSFITTQNTSLNYDYDKWNISMIIHQNTWFNYDYDKRTKHIHDHSLPHRILGSTMTTTNERNISMTIHYHTVYLVQLWLRQTNETYPWPFITTQNTWVNYDYHKRNISMIIHYHT